MNAARHLKVSIGFSGGQVLTVRVPAEAFDGLSAALAVRDGWHELALEDGSVRLDVAQIAYVRVDSDEPRVGFGA
jgi:hypothetical protein